MSIAQTLYAVNRRLRPHARSANEKWKLTKNDNSLCQRTIDLEDARRDSGSTQVTGVNPIAQDRTARSIWLINQTFDLLFVCGIAPWILGLITLFIVSPNLNTLLPSPQQQALSILFIVSSLLIGEAHQFTSILRYFSSSRSRKKGYVLQRLPFWCLYFVIILALLAFVLGSFGNSIQNVLGSSFISFISSALETVVLVGMTFFPVFLIQHFCAQAKAIGMMYCGKAGYQLSNRDKLNLSVVSWCLVLSGAFNIAIPFSSNFRNLNTIFAPEGNSALAILAPMWHFIAAIACLSLLYLFVRRGLQREEWLPRGAAVLWANMAAFVLLPPQPMVYVWLFVPVLFHASQHWCVAWTAQQEDLRKQGRDTSSATSSKLVDALRLFLPVQALSFSILFLPMLIALLQGHDEEFGVSSTGISSTLNVGFSMFVFYVHYFADRIVWRPQ